MSFVSEKGDMVPTRPRRKKTAAERRAQALRSEGRRLLHLVRSLDAIQEHRGNALGATGEALLKALRQKGAPGLGVKKFVQDKQLVQDMQFVQDEQLEGYEPEPHAFEQHGSEQSGSEQNGFEQHSFEQYGFEQHAFVGVPGHYDFEEPEPERPLWLRDPEDVVNKEYVDFYKFMCQHWEEPLAVKHFVVEGHLQFSALLFVPPRASCLRQSNSVKVYFDGSPADDSLELVPDYLDFVKGVVDFEDMPLAFAWDERCQRVRECIVHSCVEMFTEVVERGKSDRQKFHTHFSRYLRTAKHWKVAEFMRQLHLIT
eukprot:TRINITY_DN27395_c0_g1_i1.p2 TRINITY_DN27395_c0_g1~~TRINITY_DN27395_c0_g1_i1.p2  ORF type:complete len:313 (+),score=91.93 TRINITY_DN27395_c0_g1_i1:116-1054(+)